MAAVCFSVDDVHPGTSADLYEAGGGLADGALGRVVELQRRHLDLKATLCVTPDWRLKSLSLDTTVARRIPWLRRRLHWTRRHPPHHFRIDRYPELVVFLNGLERCEVVLHGLHHSSPGPRFAMEFQDQSTEVCEATVQRGLALFEAAHLRFVKGFVPPSWNAPPALLSALNQLGFRFVCSARDLTTPVGHTATTAMSGMTGVSLIHPQFVGGVKLVHLTCNFQATSPLERALRILERGGVLHIKAHIFKSGGGHTMADGLDDLYCNYLDLIFSDISRRFGDSLWWCHLSEAAERFRSRQ